MLARKMNAKIMSECEKRTTMKENTTNQKCVQEQMNEARELGSQ